MSEFFGNITAGMTLYAAANLQGKLIRLNSNTEFYSVKYGFTETLIFILCFSHFFFAGVLQEFVTHHQGGSTGGVLSG